MSNIPPVEQPSITPVEAAPPLDETVAPPPREHSRRTVVKALAGAVGLFALDQRIGKKYWGGTSPYVTTYSAEAADVFPDTAILVVGGFNVGYPEGIAGALKPTFDQYGQIGVFHHSSQGIQIDDCVRAIAGWCRQGGIRNLGFYGHSMGGMLSVEFAARLQAEHNIKPKIITLDCSPHDFGDVKGTAQQLGVRFMSVADRIGLHGGPLTRTAIETGTRYFENFTTENAFDALMHTLRKTSTYENSDKLLQKQAAYILQFRGRPFASELRDTPISHLGPTNPWNDPVVNNRRAVPGWQDDFYERPMSLASSPHTGHANPTVHPGEYNRMVEEVYTEAQQVTAGMMLSARRHSIVVPRLTSGKPS